MGISPTNRQVTIIAFTIDRIVEDKIVETWTIWDQFHLLRQLGVFPVELLKAA
jgi:predicted ester cyclase